MSTAKAEPLKPEDFRVGPVHEMHRDYFEREIVCGRRVVFLWNAAHRWPELAGNPRFRRTFPDEAIIEGFQFRTEEEAARFDLDAWKSPDQFSSAERFATWEEAEYWVRGVHGLEEELTKLRRVADELRGREDQ